MTKINATFPLDSFWAIEPLAAERLKAIVEAQGVEAMRSSRTYSPSLPMEKREGVAVIEISGPMTKRPGGLFQVLFGGTATSLVQEAVEQAAADPGIGAILLLVDSPGGSVGGLAELGDVVFKARQQKTVWAQVDGMAASAAYYVASQAERIFAGRMDWIGSIGTRLMLFDFSKRFEYLGIKAIPIVTGEFKAAGAMGTAITEEHRSYFQAIVDRFQADFLAMIVRGRKMAMGEVKAVADGKIFLAAEASRLRLIDGIQNFDGTLTQLQKLAAARRGNSSNAKADSEQPATFEQLVAAIPKADPEQDKYFLHAQVRAKATVAQAKAAWQKDLDHRIEQQKRRSAEERRAARAIAAGNDTGAEWDDPAAEFNRRVSEQMAAGKTRPEAVRSVAKRDRRLHHEMLKATNRPGLIGEFDSTGRGK